MMSNKWMIASLLIGNILLIGTVSSVPLYSNATLQRMLLKEMQQYQLDREAYPGLLEVKLAMANSGDQAINLFNYMRTYIDEVVDAFGIPILESIENIYLQSTSFYPEFQREDTPKARGVIISSYSDMENHIVITQGEMYSNELADGVFPAIVSMRTMENLNILLGETLIARTLEYDGELVRIQVVGVFENSDPNDPYWTLSPSYLSSNLIISHELMEATFVEGYSSTYRMEAIWQRLCNYNGINVRNIERYANAHETYGEYFETNRSVFRYKNSFMPIISAYQQKAEKLNITLWVLQVPVFILLAFFIFMVSKQILIIEQNEISVIKSRGASRRQIISVYLWQSFLVCIISIPAGIPLGIFICRLLGSSNGFLNLIQRTALNVAVFPEVYMFACIAAFFSLLTMTVPVISYSRVTIVDYKRGKTAKRSKAIWQRLFLDVLALGVSIYGLYTFERQKEMLMFADTDMNSIDPLLFICSSLFIIGMGLILLRIYPYFIRLIFAIGKKFWRPSFYASFLKLIRSGGEEQFIMIFLVFTLAAGIFDAKAARTINLNSEDKIKYENGADLVFKEVWSDNTDPESSTRLRDIVYREPDFEKYTKFDEADSVTRVLREKVSVTMKEGKVDNVSLMAVNTKEFGETAWFRNDLFQAHFNEYLNVVASEPVSVLLSSNFRDKYGYGVGDVISYRDARGNYISSPIHGFVDYWPGFINYTKTRRQDGRVVEAENFLIVANLDYVQSQIGLTPYEIWMRTNAASNNFIYTYAEQNNIKFASFTDSKADIIKSRNDPVLQGTNGVLTVGFITTILICATGFLIYWVLSIKSRVLQFGIFRAMGMSMRSIVSLLINEQIFITGTAIALGVIVGEISSRLFVPVIQLAYTASEQVIPFKIITQQDDYLRLMIIIGLMIATCMTILGALISKIKIAQALKLGED